MERYHELFKVHIDGVLSEEIRQSINKGWRWDTSGSMKRSKSLPGNGLRLVGEEGRGNKRLSYSDPNIAIQLEGFCKVSGEIGCVVFVASYRSLTNQPKAVVDAGMVR